MNSLMIHLENYTIHENHDRERFEAGLAHFFGTCLRRARTYACLIASDLKAFSRDSFENQVFSPDMLTGLIDRFDHPVLPMDMAEYEKGIIELSQYIHMLKKTSSITGICEKVIDHSASQLLSTTMVAKGGDWLMNVYSPGKWLLGGVERQHLQKNTQDELYRRIKGILANIHEDMKKTFISHRSNALSAG